MVFLGVGSAWFFEQGFRCSPVPTWLVAGQAALLVLGEPPVAGLGRILDWDYAGQARAPRPSHLVGKSGRVFPGASAR